MSETPFQIYPTPCESEVEFVITNTTDNPVFYEGHTIAPHSELRLPAGPRILPRDKRVVTARILRWGESA